MYNIYYLNNHGTRSVLLHNITRKKPKIRLQSPDGEVIIRTALFFEAFGNFSVCYYSWKGKKKWTFNYEVLLED